MTRGAFLLLLAACASAPPPPVSPPAPSPAPAVDPPPAADPPAGADGTPAWIGIMFDGHLGTTRVQSVIAGAPAERAGIKPGDLIASVDGAPVGAAKDVVTRVHQHTPGGKLHVVVTRGASSLPLDITLERRPDLGDLQRRLVGKPAPDFALRALAGPSATLKDLKGHVVVVDFWATWCGPCELAIPHLLELGHKYKDVRVVAISDEAEADIKQYVSDHGLDYAVARDPDDVVTGRYLVGALPTMVIIDRTGVVRALHVGAGDFDVIEAEVQQYLK